MNHQKNIHKDDLFKFKFFNSGKLSPDGKQVVYGISHADPEKEEEYVALWLMKTESGETRQLTAGNKTDTSPDWSPDGRQIAFLSTREGMPQVHVIPVDGGEARKLTNLQQPIGGGPVWSPDGKYIAFTAGPKWDAPPDPSKPYRITRSTYRFDGAGYLHNLVQDVYVIAIDEEGNASEPKQLTDDRYQNMSLAWSPDGQEILFTVAFPPDTYDVFDFSLRLVNLKGETRDVLSKFGMLTAKGWTPDSKHILFAAPKPGMPLGSKNDLWMMRSHGGEPVCLSGGLEVGVGGELQGDSPEGFDMSAIPVSPDGKKAYLSVQEGGTVAIYEIAIEGEPTWKPVISANQDAQLLDLRSGRLLYKVSNFNKPSDLFIADLDGSNQQQLTHINEDVLSGFRLPSAEHLLFKGSDGEQVEGWILLPPEGQAPYPTILYIHGGPHSAFGHTFSFDFQMLTGAGYAVLLVNHRGSTGYGSAFATAINADWGNLDYKDLMAGVDYAIVQGFTDPDRMGVCGLSGGGNLSCWIVGHTDRFKAAVPENPVVNLLSMYGTSDIGAYFLPKEMGGHPHEIPEIYAKCSPITYAHNCTTPTLLVQGEQDFRCPAEQSEQFYTMLKANGCTVELLRLPNSPHRGAIAGPIASRKAQNDALLDWMDRYVKGER